MARLPNPDPARMTPEQIRVHDAIASGPRGLVQGPLALWLHSPELADKAQALGAYCRYGTSLPPRLSELAVLVTAAWWRAGFEWAVHAPIAATTGLSAEVIEAVRRREIPRFANPDEAAVHRFARDLLDNRVVSPATWAEARALFDDRALVDLVGILGYYGLISMTIVGLEVDLPDGVSDPFADLR